MRGKLFLKLDFFLTWIIAQLFFKMEVQVLGQKNATLASLFLPSLPMTYSVHWPGTVRVLQSWTKVLGQICTFGTFAHMLDENTTSPA